MLSAGIDLSSPKCRAAYTRFEESPTLCPDLADPGMFVTEPTVCLEGKFALVGNAAEDMALLDPGKRITRQVIEMMPMNAPPDDGGWTPAALGAFVINKLLRDIDSASGTSVDNLVIACPSYFSDAERRQLEYAATLFGVTNVKVESGAVACAAHLVEQAPHQNCFIAADVGLSRSIVTAFAIEGGGAAKLLRSVEIDSGTQQIDQRIEAQLRKGAQLRGGTRGLTDPASISKFKRSVQQIRNLLTGPLPARYVTSLGGRIVPMVFNAASALALTDTLVKAIVDGVMKCLSDIDTSDRFGGLILAGATSSIPGLKERVAELLPRPKRLIDLPEATAFGAARLAAATAQLERPESLAQRGRARCDVGMRVWNAATNAPDFEVLIPSTTPLPAKQSTTLYTRRAKQERIVLDLSQRDPAVGEIVSLGSFSFGPITNPEKNYPIELSISIDQSGFLSVVARDPRTREKLSRLLSDTSRPELAHIVDRREHLLQMRVNE